MFYDFLFANDSMAFSVSISWKDSCAIASTQKYRSDTV